MSDNTHRSTPSKIQSHKTASLSFIGRPYTGYVLWAITFVPQDMNAAKIGGPVVSPPLFRYAAL